MLKIIPLPASEFALTYAGNGLATNVKSVPSTEFPALPYRLSVSFDTAL